MVDPKTIQLKIACPYNQKRKRNHRSKLSMFVGSQKKQGNQKKITCFIYYDKALTVWITRNWKILQQMGIPDHLTCLLRNLYAGQEATVRTGHGTTDYFQIGKEVRQGCILSPYFLTYMQSTSREMLGWMKSKLESRLWG